MGHRDLSIHIEGELSDIKLRPNYYRPEMGIVKTRKLEDSYLTTVLERLGSGEPAESRTSLNWFRFRRA